MCPPVRIGVVTVSDRASRGEYEDKGGPAIVAALTRLLITAWEPAIRLVPDERGLIADALHHPNLRRYKFLVVGHTSSTGDAQHNLELSARRANAITEALSTTFAIAPDRLYSIGVGEEWPLDAANPKAAENRRVQLINLGLVK